MRLLHWLFGGHHWSEWSELLIAGWTINGEPKVRYCVICGAFDYNTDGRILSAIAFGAKP